MRGRQTHESGSECRRLPDRRRKTVADALRPRLRRPRDSTLERGISASEKPGAAVGHLNANSYPATSARSVNIQSMWKYRVFVRELDRVFSRGPKLLNAHIARMVVLYHDL